MKRSRLLAASLSVVASPSHIHYYDQTDHFWRAVEIAERAAHDQKLPQPETARKNCSGTTIEQACDALTSKEVDAVLYDSPVLRNYVDNEGKGLAAVTGAVFRHEAYGVLYPTTSPMHKPLDKGLLKLRETGGYSEVDRKWFGATAGATP